MLSDAHWYIAGYGAVTAQTHLDEMHTILRYISWVHGFPWHL